MAQHSGPSAGRSIPDALSISGKRVVAAIDFRRTRIYLTSAARGQGLKRVVEVDAKAPGSEISHKTGNPDGTYEAGNAHYWREITDALSSASEILLLGHGNGKANASHQWVAYVEKHAKDVAAKVVADVRADIDDLSDTDVVRLAQHHFGSDSVVRYHGDDPGVARPMDD